MIENRLPIVVDCVHPTNKDNQKRHKKKHLLWNLLLNGERTIGLVKLLVTNNLLGID